MKGKEIHSWWKQSASWVLALSLLLSLCAGCGGDTPPVPESRPLEWTSVQTGAEIDTVNVVMVIDTSASTLKNDPDRNWLEASCMFLNTLYASASKQESDRLPGSKRANVGVILYNDTAIPYSDTLMNLASKPTVDDIKRFVRRADISAGSGDDALAAALDTATEMLHNHSAGQEGLTERSVILLFTDGYTPYGSMNPLPAEQGAVQSSIPAGAFGAGGGYGSYDGTTSATASTAGGPPTDYASGADGGPVSYSGGTGETAGGPPAGYASSGTNIMPNFGDRHQAQLETALNRAKDSNYEIFVLMLNPDNSSNGGWEQFKGIANYTKRNFMAKLVPVLISLGMDARFEGMPRSLDEFTFPDDYSMPAPAFISDPMYGGGVFANPDDSSEKVTYLMAKSSAQLMTFYATMAANMLSGSSATEFEPRIGEYEGTQHYCYDIEVPSNSVSALMCFFFSNDGIAGINLRGPDPNRTGEQKDYTQTLRKQDTEGWANNGTMRNDWYAHTTSTGEGRNNIVTLTIMNPDPGMWTVYVLGKDGNNRSLHTYATLVSGAKVNIEFGQGNDLAGGSHPVTGGDFAVQVSGNDGNPLPTGFYNTLKTQCTATRIPPWVPITGESDITDLMKNPTGWVQQVLSSFKRPETWLTQMSGGEIKFNLAEDSDENPVLMGHYEAPLPGLYYVTMVMTSGEGTSQIDYSKSFWVTYEPKTDFQVTVKVDHDTTLSPPYFPEAWRRTSNTSVSENLVLNIDGKSLKITPSDIATVELDPKDQQSVVIHPQQKGSGTLSFDVTTEYGDRWTLNYDVVVN